jgi:hypothetical protein
MTTEFAHARSGSRGTRDGLRIPCHLSSRLRVFPTLCPVAEAEERRRIVPWRVDRPKDPDARKRHRLVNH